MGVVSSKSKSEFDRYYFEFKSEYAKGNYKYCLPASFIPKDLETYLMVLEKLYNELETKLFFTLISFFTIDYNEEKKNVKSKNDKNRLEKIDSMKIRVKEMFLDRTDIIVTKDHFPDYCTYADYIDPVLLLEKIIKVQSASVFSEILHEMNDKRNRKKVTIKIPSFDELKEIVPKSIKEFLNPDEAIIFAEKVVKSAAHSGYKDVIEIMTEIVDPQEKVCREIELYLSDPHSKFYESYAGGMLPITKMITLEGKKKISKLEYMIDAIRLGQGNKVRFMLECFPFEQIDQLFRDEIIKIEIKSDELNNSNYEYKDIYEILYLDKFNSDLRNHNWKLADIFLRDYEKYFGHKYRCVTNSEMAFDRYLRKRLDFEVFKYLGDNGLVMEFEMIYCRFRNILGNIIKYDHSKHNKKFIKNIQANLPELNFSAKILCYCLNSNIEIKSCEMKTIQQTRVGSEIKILRQNFRREPFEESFIALGSLIQPICDGNEITIDDVTKLEKQTIVAMREKLIAISRKYFKLY